MSDLNLQQQLEELRHTLASHPQLDAESLVLLQQIAADIEQMGGEANPGLGDLVQEQALNFEQEHPTLAAVLHQIVITLGRMGV